MTEMLFFWFALTSYVMSSVVFIGGLTFEKDRLKKSGVLLALLGLLLHTVTAGIRWIAVGHGPYISTFEILSSNVWIGVLFFLLFQWQQKKFVNLGAIVMPLSFLMMGFALMGSREARALPPSLRSAWLIVHILFAKLTVAAMLVAVSLAVFYLLKTRRFVNPGSILAKLPAPPVIDDYGYRLTAFGFVSLSIMIVTGIIWGNYAWGSYWSWDPAQTWSLVVWLVYGLYLHGRMTFRWKGSLSSWYIILAFFFSILAFFIIPYFVKGLHSQYMVD